MSQDSNPGSSLPPDIIQHTLPFLSQEDIKNLSQTNKYYHKLLNFTSSETLWHELFRKKYGTLFTNAEPLYSKITDEYNTCVEKIMVDCYPTASWESLYRLRSGNCRLYTWGSIRHGRLGYTSSSNSAVTDDMVNGHLRFPTGVNTPVCVPWYSAEETSEDKSIVQISGGGFSFQILTGSGKIFSTGSTFTGGNNGPGLRDGDQDYNPFTEVIRRMERPIQQGAPFDTGRTTIDYHTTSNLPPILTVPLTYPQGRNPLLVPHRVVPTSRPHENVYSSLDAMEKQMDEHIPGNKYVRRMFTRDCLPIYTDNPESLEINQEKLNGTKFIAIASGRSHFIALSEDNTIYSWDNNQSLFGVKLSFDNLPPTSSNPILKIACGWDFSCAYIYDLGLVLWDRRHPLKQGDTTAEADYEVIPGTGSLSGDERIVDFTCTMGKTVYYINSSGTTLFKYKNREVFTIEIPIHEKISKLISNYNSLLVFTTERCYSFLLKDGEMQPSSLVELHLDDPDDRIAAVSGGDYHTVALTKKGQLYSWGTESQLSGCLGLGKPDYVVNEAHWGEWDGPRNIKVLKPTKIQLNFPYCCVSVAAGGWQSGALIIEK